MKRLFLICSLTLFFLEICSGEHRRWTVADGLPTGEVWQIVELPSRQMLVNCEGVFCISNGAGFDVLPCDYGRTYQLPEYADGYGRLWQGDSLLWLHDFYRLFLFDARQRAFRYDIEQRLSDPALRRFAQGEVLRDVPTEAQWRCIDSLGLARNYGTVAVDYQGGLWVGTRNEGIVYLSPRPMQTRELTGGDWRIGVARSYTDRQGRIWRCRADGVEVEENGIFTLYNKENVQGLPYNRTTFVCQLLDGRYLLCDSLSTLGYFTPGAHRFEHLNAKLPALDNFRHFVGACPINRQWTAVYAQSGIVLLDTQADTLACFPAAAEISRYATKYNCLLLDHDGRLWLGTQNGLFWMNVAESLSRDSSAHSCMRIEGLANNCIRSLVLDQRGNVWAGTSCGISRITPSVLNLGVEDGVPAMAMMERAAYTTKEGLLVFAVGGDRGIVFHPDSLAQDTMPKSVVITGCWEGPAREMSLLAQLPRFSLPYDQNYLTLQFSTLNYAASSHTSYRYRLLPMQQQWNTSSGVTGQGSAIYTALPHGDYRFEVQASLPDGTWVESTMVEFCIRPPLWLTWWAKLLYALFTVLFVVGVLSFYLRHRRRQMERENEARVNQLFELREEARHQFAQAVNIDPGKIAASHEEEVLVGKMLKAIGQNMDNCDYTVDQLASDVGMSRANLYKKMQTLLGITPNDFLRNVRLKHAAKLLLETNEPVNQISLQIGFQTTRYFSQCFRSLFGMTPSEFRRENSPSSGANPPGE
ncbi:MAG: helix-turn-helix domain-containing protein [Bacteroidaceae bacterium]|nr:helix-turn-helix domain-containing protein [Bacteroidaceae bacterium]MBQ9191987.1 helix-turn-helix domain-containing protein [Bacteroidaceae bacterium]